MYYARQAPDKFGREGAAHSWFQVIHQAGAYKIVELDFLASFQIAANLAVQLDLKYASPTF